MNNTTEEQNTLGYEDTQNIYTNVYWILMMGASIQEHRSCGKPFNPEALMETFRKKEQDPYWSRIAVATLKYLFGMEMLADEAEAGNTTQTTEQTSPEAA